jgi:hypothetical protein
LICNLFPKTEWPWTALILALLGRAKARCFAFVIDRPENNVIELEPAVTDQPSDGYEAIDLSVASFPTHPGGLFRNSLSKYLVATQSGGQDADSPDVPVKR